MIQDRQDWFNLARVIFWLVLTPAAWQLDWLDKVAFVSLLSIWALVETSWGALQAYSNKVLREQLERIEAKLDRLCDEKTTVG